MRYETTGESMLFRDSCTHARAKRTDSISSPESSAPAVPCPAPSRRLQARPLLDHAERVHCPDGSHRLAFRARCRWQKAVFARFESL